jgi:hypothetical protein
MDNMEATIITFDTFEYALNGCFVDTKKNIQFWRDQFSLYMAGCRDARMHDNTLSIMSMFEGNM